MQKLLFVNDVAERYRISKQTARKIMRSMAHSEWPKLCVTESVLSTYEKNQTVLPSNWKSKRK